MPQLPRSRRSYDHRIREIVCQTGKRQIFQRHRVPRFTTASWLSRGRRSVVSLDGQHDIASLLDENETLKPSGFRLDEQRLPDGKAEARVLRGRPL